MTSKEEVRVALTRTAVGHWERYFSYVAPIEKDLRELPVEENTQKLRDALADEKERYYAQLCGAMAAVRSLARSFNVAIMTNEQLRAKGLERYKTNQRRAELEHQKTK
jgi:hypothetical protein